MFYKRVRNTPQRLDWSRSFIEDYKAVTLEDVNALAKEFLQTKDRVMVTIIPTAPAKVEKKEE